MHHTTPTSPTRAFTLVELLVVIGVITILISLMLPALSRARRQSEMIRCAAQMKQIGDQMLIYAGMNRGWLFPPMLGVNVPPHERWPVAVFNLKNLPSPPSPEASIYIPKILLCPSDATDVLVQPGSSPYVTPGQLNTHTYVISHNIGHQSVTYSKKDLGGLTPSDFIIMGEKNSQAPDMYLGTRPRDPSDFKRVVDFYRHGRLGNADPNNAAANVRSTRQGSNYLHLDMHVESRTEDQALRGIDPWSYGPNAGTIPNDPTEPN